MVVSYRESCQGMKFNGSPKNGEMFRETHKIGHANCNNDIAKDTPNIPYLWGNVIGYSEKNLRDSSYANASALEERRFMSDGDQRVIFLLLCVNANRYPAAKLNEGKLCTVKYFYSIQILDTVELFTTYNHNCCSNLF